MTSKSIIFASANSTDRWLWLQEWWNGRHEGLKILWSLRLCGFESRFEHDPKSQLSANKVVAIFILSILTTILLFVEHFPSSMCLNFTARTNFTTLFRLGLRCILVDVFSCFENFCQCWHFFSKGHSAPILRCNYHSTYGVEILLFTLLTLRCGLDTWRSFSFLLTLESIRSRSRSS